jgi:hypothetical protein
LLYFVQIWVFMDTESCRCNFVRFSCAASSYHAEDVVGDEALLR